MAYSIDADGWSVITPSGTWQNGYNGAAPASGTSMIVYVSSSTGKDSGDGGYVAGTAGSSATPYRTIASGMARLRNGEPDWLLLLKGDVWTDETIHTGAGALFGKSATEPMVIGAYGSGVDASHPSGTGSGVRPQIKHTHAITPFSLNVASNGKYIAMLSVDFYCYDRDPDNVSYAGKTVTGAANNGSGKVRLALNNTTGMTGSWHFANIVGTTEANTPGGPLSVTVIDGTHVDINVNFVNAYVSGGDATPGLSTYSIDLAHGTDWNLFEDCKVSYSWGIRCQVDASTNRQNSFNNLYFRRNIITKNYGNMGLFINGYGYGYNGTTINSLVLYQNFIDHNSWATNWFRKGKNGTLFSHNIYGSDIGATTHNGNDATPTYESGPVIVDGNISSRDSVGSHFKGGGILSNNLWARNGGGFDIMRPSADFPLSITGDVFLEFEPMDDSSASNGGGISLTTTNSNDSILVSISGDTITFPYAHQFVVDAPLRFDSFSGSAPPSPFVRDGTRYFVVDAPTSTTIKISATKGGGAITADAPGTPRVFWGCGYNTISVTNNWFANYTGSLSVVGFSGYAVAAQADCWKQHTISNNIIYQFGKAASGGAGGIRNNNTYSPGLITISGNDEYQNTSFDTVPAAKYAWLLQRSLADYAYRIGVGSTSDDLFDYIGANQRKDNWDTRLTAAAIIAYYTTATNTSTIRSLSFHM